MKLTSVSLDKLEWLFSHPRFRENRIASLYRVFLWEVHRFRNDNIALKFDDSTISVDCHDGVGRILYYFGEVDREIFLFLENYLKTGFVVLDVGANIGIYSKFAARRVQPNGIVHSFEPNLEIISRLKQNTDGLPVKIWPYAVSDKCGHINLHLSDDTAKSSVVDGHTSVRDLRIECTTIDSFYEKHIKNGVIDYLKIDVEGHDFKVLLGAQKQFAKQNIRFTQIECFVAKKEIRQFIYDNSYELGTINSNGVLTSLGRDGELTGNIFAYSKDFAKEMLG